MNKGYPKQVILIRKDLKMSSGKLGSQVAHAAMGPILELFRKNHIYVDENTHFYTDENKYIPAQEWLNGSFTKICLAVHSEDELDTYHTEAKNRGFPCALIVDEGRTVFDGVSTPTCLSIGPMWSDDLNELTGSLRLYR